MRQDVEETLASMNFFAEDRAKFDRALAKFLFQGQAEHYL